MSATLCRANARSNSRLPFSFRRSTAMPRAAQPRRPARHRRQRDIAARAEDVADADRRRRPGKIGAMTSPKWSPDQYLKFAAARGRAFDDLVARIQTENPATVVDLGW